MKNITPFFELDGQRYEIKRTRYLIAEYDKLGEENQVSNEDKENAIKVQRLIGEVQKYAEKVEALWKELEEKPSKETRDKYYLFKEMQDNALSELAKLEAETGSTTRLQKAGIDLLEKVAIKGLAAQHFNFDETKAKLIWEKYVDSLDNQNEATEWLTYMGDCLFSNEEDEVEENSFLAQMRKKAKEKAENRKKGMKKR